ncbi:hypothetical protein [Streptomyces sp. NPDC089799]|uniref:type II secretion system F family protein n=1 Tax=Streptomyces sp. NPDC089799 TaxID=3155066 RepID=UPI00343560A3
MSGLPLPALVPWFVAVLCAGAAVRLPAAGGRSVTRARLLLAGSGPGVPARGSPKERLVAVLRVGAGRWWPEGVCLGAGLLVALAGRSPVPLVVGVLAVPVLRRRLSERRAARERAARAAAVVALCGSVVGELRAGAQPGQALGAALRRTAVPGAEESAVLAAAAFGGDVAGALREAAGEPGAEGLAGMAACWRVSVDGGAGLAAGLERLEGALRAERDRAESLRAQLAGARSTTVVLALLPLVGLLIGTGLGADPLRVLLHGPLGAGCLVVGGVLEALGLLWCRRIVRAGEG